MSQNQTVLVAGSQGVFGRAAAIHLAKQPGTTVYGLSRRNLTESEGFHNICVDSLNLQDVSANLLKGNKYAIQNTR